MTIGSNGDINRLIWQGGRYGLVGVANTAIGLGTIYVLMYFANMTPVSANVVGYGLALTNSFILNRSWTFKSDRKGIGTIVRFLAVFLLAYSSQIVLLVFLLHADVDAYPAQAMATVGYVVIGFFGNKYITFGR